MKSSVSLSRIILILAIQFLYYQNSTSQENEPVFKAKNTLFLEASFKEPFYSINFDRIFFQAPKLNWTWHAGFSITCDIISLPVGVDLFTGKNNSHAVFGLTFIPYIAKYSSMFSDNDLSDKYGNVISTIGYRFQKPNGGLFFQAQVSPAIHLDPPSGNFWKMDPKLWFIGMLAVGYSF